MSAIGYYGWAKNKVGKVEQVRVKVINHRTFQSFTGKIYKNDREAALDAEKLNCREMVQ